MPKDKETLSDQEPQNVTTDVSPEDAAPPTDVDEAASPASNVEEELPSADWQAELDRLRQTYLELNDQYLRALADMENLRRRHRQELAERQQFANERLVQDLLPVLDNLERALEVANASGESGGLKGGVELTARQFLDVLQRYGVAPIEAVGQPFDPMQHEAVGQWETNDYPEGVVAVEVQRGYTLHGRTVRPSRVMVAKRPMTNDQ